MSLAVRVPKIVLVVVLSVAPACDGPPSTDGPTDRDGRAGVENEGRSSEVVWGCDESVPELDDEVEAGWRKKSTVVGDFGFYGTAGDLSGFRPHRRAALQVKLPVMIEGHSGATVSIPRSERNRVALILADVPRRGPGNSYRIRDGYGSVRFEPCESKEWTAWTAGLALAEGRATVFVVEVDDAPRPERVSLGPWEVFLTGKARQRGEGSPGGVESNSAKR